MNNTLKQYELFLNSVQERLNSYFEQQKDYICCKEKCSVCCSNSYYPAFELEYDYARLGFMLLDDKTRQKILDKTIQIIKQRKEFLKTNSNVLDFEYVCPFLEDDYCKIYNYRPLTCRTHGLITKSDERAQVPHCVNLGLNYSKVYDFERKMITQQKIDEHNYESEPSVYDVSLSSLISFAPELDFGSLRVMAEWVFMDIENYRELLNSPDFNG